MNFTKLVRQLLSQLLEQHNQEITELRTQIAALQEQVDRLSRPIEPVDPPDPIGPPDPVDPPPSSYSPPQVAMRMPMDDGPLPEIVNKWFGTVAELNRSHSDTRMTTERVLNSIVGKEPFGTAVFKGTTIENASGAMYTVGVDCNMPSDIGPDETWKNSARATPFMGTMFFQGVTFGPTPGDDSWAGYGGKMWLHPQSVASFMITDCTFEPVREHGFYGEWTRNLHIENCLFKDSGGNAIQVASRGGHDKSNSYYHGNRLNRPAGYFGSAFLKDIVINEKFHEFRDASDISFFGFGGPIVVENARCNNTISAMAITTDPYKGAWLYPEGTGDPILWRLSVEGKNPPVGVRTYLTPDGYHMPQDHYGYRGGLWINNLTANIQPERKGTGRAMVMLAGLDEIHINEFSLDTTTAEGQTFNAIVFDNWWGGQVRNKRRPGTNLPNVYFYDADSLFAHEGRIGEEIPHPTDPGKGKFRAFTRAELEQLLVTQESSGGSGGDAIKVPTLPPVEPKDPRPGAHNTGPSDPSLLVPTGSITADVDGMVIENVDITGTLVVEADNVTIRNFRIDAQGASYGINASWNNNILIEDGEIINAGSAGLMGKNLTARRLNIHHVGKDAMKIHSNSLIEACWVHEIGMSPGAHADANQTRSGSNITFRGNNFDIPVGVPGHLSNACQIIQDEVGPIDNILLEGNWFNGGNYTIYLAHEDFGGPTNCVVRNNRFGRDYQYGTMSAEVPFVAEGNVWDDTGELLDWNN